MRNSRYFFCGLLFLFNQAHGFPIGLEDIFGRRVETRHVTLVDSDGYLANPAIKLFVVPTDRLSYPATLTLSTDDPRLYFSAPSLVGTEGASLSISLSDSSVRPSFYLSIWPDRNGVSEQRALRLLIRDAKGMTEEMFVDVLIEDQDKERPPLFDIAVDFSKDRSGFFDDSRAREAIELAAKDWAYFLGDGQWDSVAKHSEPTWLWDPDHLVSSDDGYHVTNERPYRGFLLYVTGNTLTRAGGGTASETFQTSQGVPGRLRRSGHVAIGPVAQGPGYLFSLLDSEWWKFIYQSDLPVELLSLAQHEMGHSLFFNWPYPVMKQWIEKKCVDTPEILTYHGECIPVDENAHFRGVIDRQSRKGLFGSGKDDMPMRRWISTKADLLIAQSIGYKLRDTSAFLPLSLTTRSLREGAQGRAYSDTLRAEGGVPFYYWTIQTGSLPEGLSLNSFTGEISGVPTQCGKLKFTVNLRDYEERDLKGKTQTFQLRIHSPANK